MNREGERHSLDGSEEISCLLRAFRRQREMRGLECPGVVRNPSICLYVWEKDPRNGLWPDMMREEKTANMIKSVCMCVYVCFSVHACITCMHI